MTYKKLSSSNSFASLRNIFLKTNKANGIDNLAERFLKDG